MGEPPLAAEQLKRLIAAGQMLVSDLDLERVLDHLLETAQDLTGARFAALGVLDESRTELRRFLTRGVTSEQQRAIGPLPRGRGILGVLIDDPRPLRLHDLAEHPSSFGFPDEHPPMRTFLGVPIVIRGETWGTVYLTEKRGGADFDAADEASTVALAAWAAIAVENARLYNRAESRRVELEWAVRGFQASSAIAQALGGEMHLDRVLELIVDRGRVLVEARSVLILLLGDDDHLTVASAAGQAVPMPDTRLPIDGSTAGRVLRERRSLRIDDADAQLLVPSARLGVPDATRGLLVPLTYRGRALGVLAAFDKLTSADGFDDEDQELLEAFAASAAIAVTTARSVAAERLRMSITASEAERRRWARELHDETLQGLAAVKVMLAGGVRGATADAMRGALTTALEHVTDDIDTLRSIITELRPDALDALGLVPALSTLAARTQTVQGLEVHAHFELDIDEGRRLQADLETTIYRVVQEALTNVAKHARASTVDIGVRRSADHVQVVVGDDGAGFDATTAAAGFGLLGMRERVDLVGGSLQVDSSPAGTTISAELPLNWAQASSRTP